MKEQIADHFQVHRWKFSDNLKLETLANFNFYIITRSVA
jgi:hypothetical protein